MEATQITVSEQPLTKWVPPKFSSQLHHQTRLQTLSGNQSCSFHHTRRGLLCHQGTERTQVSAFRLLFCQTLRRRLNLSCVLHLLLQVNGGKMRQRKLLELGHLPFLRLFCQGKHTDWNCPPCPGTIVTICMSCFMTGGPAKEHRTNKPPPTGRVQERSKGDTTGPTTSQNPLWHPSWLNKVCATRKDSESE